MFSMIDTTEKSTGTNTSDSSQSGTTVKRKRGEFPRLPLKKAIELAKAVYDVGQGEPVRRLKVFDSLGRSANSGTSRALVIASGSYGLTQGGYQADYLQLTEIGKDLVTTDSQLRKHEIVYNILFGNEIFSSFIEYWKNKAVPADDIASDWLIRNHKLGTDDAQSFWEVIKANIFDFNLTEQLSGKYMIISKDAAIESIQKKEGGALSEQDVFKQESSDNPSAFLDTPDSQLGSQDQSAVKPALSKKEFRYGTAQLILPGKMTADEISKLKTIIDGLVDVVSE